MSIVQPNFLLIGAQKAGTTWLSAMLRQHPDVFVPPSKELHFFNLRENYQRGLDWYEAQFEGYSGQTAIGECTPNYLWVSDAPQSLMNERAEAGAPVIEFQDYPFLNRNIPALVHEHYPDLKLLVSLRNPVDRAVSRYYHAIRARKLSPRSRILDVGGREGILGMGFYYRHLREWFEYFPKERFLILIYEEDLAEENKAEALRKVFRFLDVDPDVLPKNVGGRYNVRKSHAFMYLNYYFPRLARLLQRGKILNRLPIPRMEIGTDDIEQLYRLYRHENCLLEEMLGRSLAIWHPE